MVYFEQHLAGGILRMKRKLLEWGVKPSNANAWIGNFQCGRCGQDLIDLSDSLVGFSHAVMPSQTGQEGAIGTLVVKCRKCSRLYWMHAYESTIDSILLNKKACSNWPKPRTIKKNKRRKVRRLNRSN